MRNAAALPAVAADPVRLTLLIRQPDLIATFIAVVAVGIIAVGSPFNAVRPA